MLTDGRRAAFGVDFNQINKSDLLRVDHHGAILDHGRVKVLNKAAFLIHGAIHAARPDVMCAAHTHSVYVVNPSRHCLQLFADR